MSLLKRRKSLALTEKSKYIPVIIVVYFVIAVILYPMVHVIKDVIIIDNKLRIQEIAYLFSSKAVIISSIRTFAVSILTVLFVLILSLFQIYAIDFIKVKASPVFGKIVFIPLFLNSIPFIMVLRIFFLNFITLFNDGVMGSYFKIIFAQVYSLSAFTYLFIKNSYIDMDGHIIEQSFLLNASPVKTFLKVVIPNVKHSIVFACIYAFIQSVAAYAAPLMLGAKGFQLSTQVIIDLFRMGQYGLSLTYCLMIVLINIVPIVLLLHLYKKVNLSTGKTKKEKEVILYKKCSRSICLNTVCIMLCLLYVLPLLVSFVYSFVDSFYIGLGMTPQNYTLDNYREVFKNSSFVKNIINSIWVSCLASLLTLIIAVIINYYKEFRLIKFSKMVFYFFGLIFPIFIPLMFLTTFSKLNIFTLFTLGVGSYYNLPIALTVCMGYVMIMRIDTVYGAIDKYVLEASLNLNKGKYFNTYVKIVLPQLFPVIITTFSIQFIRGMTDYTLSEMLYMPVNKPFSLIFNETLTSTSYMAPGRTIVYSIILLVINAFVFTLCYLISKMYNKYVLHVS